MSVTIHKNTSIPELEDRVTAGEDVWVWITWSEELDTGVGIASQSFTLPDGWEDSNTQTVLDGTVNDEDGNSYDNSCGVFFTVPSTATGTHKITNTIVTDETPPRTIPRSVKICVTPL